MGYKVLLGLLTLVVMLHLKTVFGDRNEGVRRMLEDDLYVKSLGKLSPSRTQAIVKIVGKAYPLECIGVKKDLGACGCICSHGERSQMVWASYQKRGRSELIRVQLEPTCGCPPCVANVYLIITSCPKLDRLILSDGEAIMRLIGNTTGAFMGTDWSTKNTGMMEERRGRDVIAVHLDFGVEVTIKQIPSKDLLYKPFGIIGDGVTTLDLSGLRGDKIVYTNMVATPGGFTIAAFSDVLAVLVMAAILACVLRKCCCCFRVCCTTGTDRNNATVPLETYSSENPRNGDENLSTDQL